MHQDIQILLAVSGFVCAAIVGASAMPPLTARGGNSPASTSQEAFERTVTLERSYCRKLGGGTNCECFANKSSVILTNEEPRVPGMIYPERRALARSQAKASC